jgi:hypothetical protein
MAWLQQLRLPYKGFTKKKQRKVCKHIANSSRTLLETSGYIVSASTLRC